MTTFKRKYIDWEKTAINLRLLRRDNIDLRRYVCRCLKTKNNHCDGENCSECKYEMDHGISQSELAQVFNVSEAKVANWENNRSAPSADDLAFFCQITGKQITEIIVFK